MVVPIKFNSVTDIFILFLLLLSSGCSLHEHFYKPIEGYVATEELALGIAEFYLDSIYGEESVDLQKPLNAVLKNGIWTITGTLQQPTNPEYITIGGVAEIHLSKSSGKVLRITHGK